ncbi:voltage-dependent T-type calcium channel subunit alpha-1G [Schistocerca nitens]|uniref:voltage-dependent T-type calcium channel subunit alpha-1G n=1 Tax=Schistocerca nitens TaxID=7011 RepID=UPI002118438D|nr:voltage-dependent T-type calcium channel subunit alpha-1G [Schistocerca nitens]
MYRPCIDDPCTTNRCKILQIFDDFIFAFFALEMSVKMIAMGAYGKGTYLADPWNWLDFFIVIAGALEYCLNVENMNLSAIRTIRVLRPLRAINRIPSMRILVMLLLDTLPMLGNVLLLCFFVFFIFGIVGVQLWQGILRQRCFPKTPPNVTLPKAVAQYYHSVDQERDYICSTPKDSGMHLCRDLPPLVLDSGLVCNATALPNSPNEPTNASCVNWNQYYTECLPSPYNPFQGTISFDNIGLAWVAIFLVISLEGWTDIMYYVQDAHSFWDWIYFVLLIVIGSFFMINLCLVVIATQFSETKKREMERMRLERERFRSSSTLASSTNNSEPTSCYAEIVKYVAHLWRRGKRRLMKKWRVWRYRRQQRRQAKAGAISLQHCGNNGAGMLRAHAHHHHHHHHHHRHGHGHGHHHSNHHHGHRGHATPGLLSPPGGPRRRSSVMFSEVVLLHGGAGCPLSESACGAASEAMTCQELLALSGALSAALPTGQLALDSFFSSLSKGPGGGEPLCCQEAGCWELELESGLSEGACCAEQPWAAMLEDKAAAAAGAGAAGAAARRRRQRWRHALACCTGCLRWVRRGVRALVTHKYFQQGILFAILINTLSMGIEYHDQPEELTVTVEISNIVFSAIFAVEMMLKIIAEGPFGYISNGFNVFDGVIVVLSVIEMCQTYLGEGEGSSGLSVLRTFRLLRILKLVRFMPNLRRQLFVMLRTMDNVAVFFSLLILFIFIFSILGMNLFGCKFCNKADNGDTDECDRKNFDSLLWAIVTVFQILTQEDWNVVLFNGMEKTTHWAALYFVALMTFGNYVLFNLLVAILVEGFSAERNERREREQRELAKQQQLKNEQMHREAQLAASSYECSRTDSSSDTTDSYFATQGMTNEWRSAEELRKSKHNGHREKENSCHRRRHLLHDCEPKCNIQKESKMLSQPPIITHTAATPQDSPNTTMDPGMRDCRLAPVLALHGSSMSLESIDRSLTSEQSVPGLLKPPNTKFSGNGASGPGGSSYNNHGNNHNNNNGHQLHQGRRVSLVAIVSSRRESTASSTSGSRGCPWKLSRPSLRRRASRRSSDADDASAEADADAALPVLNNGLNNHNHLASPTDRTSHRSCSQCGEHAHAHCNGGLVGSIRNDTGSGGGGGGGGNGASRQLSPQGSLRGHASYCPLPQASLVSCRADDELPQPKCVNALVARGTSPPSSFFIIQISGIWFRFQSLTTLPQQNRTSPHGSLSSGSAEGATPTPPEAIKKIFMFFEPRGCLKERDDYSLYMFPPRNRFRLLCCWFVEQKWFDNMVLLFIGLNCITLAMERPNIPPDSPERLFLSTANYVFTAVFAIEMFVKVIATGMIYGRDAYFTSGWNIMDGSLVIISIIDLLMSLVSESSPRIFGILRVFRLLRSLRPLRVINRAPGLKLVVQTLLSSLRPIGNIVLICCTFFIIFGILGVQLFKGTFYYCEGADIKNVRNKTDCLKDKNNRWVNRKYNFDDLGKALMSLFVLSSRDGWVNIMYTGLDAVGVDQQPIENYSEWRLLYFIAFILLVGFFVLNMFVGVVVENFHRCREEQEKEERVRRAAKRAKQMEKKRRKMHEPPYYTNYTHSRLMIHNVVTSKYFDLAIAAVIGLNVVTMALEFYKMPKPLEYALKIFNYFFTAVFILEAVMKLVALGFLLYFKDRWNQLDVIIVILSIVGIVLEEVESKFIPINPTIIRVMRVLRIARVLKLLKMAKGIRALLDTVMQALPQVGNLGLLFFLLFFIFAALGVELFGRLECSEKRPCQGLGEHAHFSNFGMAFLTLFRVATGDNWNGIMKDTLREDCDNSADCVRNCCVSTVIAPIFFVIFVLMAQFVLVNVVVAVLMKHLEESHKQMEDELDMEVELERELAAEQEELLEEEQQEELQRVLEMELAMSQQQQQQQQQQEIQLQQAHPTLTRGRSLPADFMFTSLDSAAETDEGVRGMNERRRDSTELRSRRGAHNRRRQTFHSHQGPLLPPSIPPAYPATEYTAVYKAASDINTDTVEENAEEESPNWLLPQVKEKAPIQRTASDPHEGSRGLLAVPGLRRSDLGSTQRLELLVGTQSRRTDWADPESVTPSDDISPDCVSPTATLIPPPYRAATAEQSTLQAPVLDRTMAGPRFLTPSLTLVTAHDLNRSGSMTSSLRSENICELATAIQSPPALLTEKAVHTHFQSSSKGEHADDSLSSDASSLELTNVTPLFVTHSEITVSVPSSSSSSHSGRKSPSTSRPVIVGEVTDRIIVDCDSVDSEKDNVCKIDIDTRECKADKECDDTCDLFQVSFEVDDSATEPIYRSFISEDSKSAGHSSEPRTISK